MKIVRDLAVAFGDYTHVPARASLAEAIKALVQAMAAPRGEAASRPRDRGVLVEDESGRVIGKLSIWDLLGGLTPNFEPPIDPFGREDDRLFWAQWLGPELADRARSTKIGDLVRRSPNYETIEETAPLDLAVYRLIRGRRLSLLVTRGEDIVGILRLSDVLMAVDGMIASAAERAPA